MKLELEEDAASAHPLLVHRDVDTGQDYFTDIHMRWDRTFNEEKKEMVKCQT